MKYFKRGPKIRGQLTQNGLLQFHFEQLLFRTTAQKDNFF